MNKLVLLVAAILSAGLLNTSRQSGEHPEVGLVADSVSSLANHATGTRRTQREPMTMVTIRTWERLTSGVEIDTGIDETWDSGSDYYVPSSPTAYQASGSHDYWFGKVTFGGQSLTSHPAQENASHQPTRFDMDYNPT